VWECGCVSDWFKVCLTPYTSWLTFVYCHHSPLGIIIPRDLVWLPSFPTSSFKSLHNPRFPTAPDCQPVSTYNTNNIILHTSNSQHSLSLPKPLQETVPTVPSNPSITPTRFMVYYCGERTIYRTQGELPSRNLKAQWISWARTGVIYVSWSARALATKDPSARRVSNVTRENPKRARPAIDDEDCRYRYTYHIKGSGMIRMS